MANLTVTVAAPLPADHFERSDVLARIKPHLDQLKASLASVGAPGLTVDTHIGEPPKKRGPKAKPPGLSPTITAE